MGTGGPFPGVKRPGREAAHSPPASAEVKKMWIYTSITQYAFMAYTLCPGSVRAVFIKNTRLELFSKFYSFYSK
jgi:hypothetical protein